MGQNNAAPDSTQLLRKYLETRKVLIVDSNAAARSSLYNVLHELGAPQHLLTLANTYNQGVQQITELKPHLVLAEYDLGKHCGLELLQSQRELRPEETKECVFIIVTANTSQSAAARALEEDIDAYIIKPYTLEFVRKTIITAVVNKLKPAPYFAKIEEGKKALAQDKFDEAEKLFTEASALDQTPSLAFYYLGFVKFLREVVAEAQSNYMKGLKFNAIHYKCLVGYYDLLMKEKRFEDAYEIVKKISKYFPANPKRLSNVLRLAIMIGRYEDIERYYNVFANIETRNEMLVRHVSAALVICGKYYLGANRGAGKAADIFSKAAATSANSPKVLNEIVAILVEYNLGKEAQKFLERFPPESQSQPDYLLAHFLVVNSTGKLAMIIDLGRKLLAKGLVDIRLYQTMIQRSVEGGLQAAAEDIFHEAAVKFPDRKSQLEELLFKKPAAP